jgi:hypothetical protein
MDNLVREELQLRSVHSEGMKPVLLGSQAMAGLREIEITRLATHWYKRGPFAGAGNHRHIPLGKIVEYAVIARLLSAMSNDV